MSLIIDDVAKSFGRHAALGGVSLEAREGEFLALLGPSGSGKTTLLRVLAGLERPDRGAVRFQGEDLLAVDARERRVGMVFQHYALFRHMTVARNIAFGLEVKARKARLRPDEIAARVEELLKLVQLEGLGGRYPAQLSGGQRQRVALARCLVTEPDVVLLDEPLANLDRHLRQEMEETFREFHARSGATMIYVTHDQAEAMALATDVAVMSQGKLLQIAPPAELYARPEGRLVGSLVGQGAILRLPVPDGASRDLDWAGLRAAMESGAQLPLADILVRPQDVLRDAEGIDCTVTSVLYEGERYALRLDLPDGQALRAYSREAVAIGDRLPVAIRAAWRL